AADEGGQTEAGSFFLGRAVDDPGPLFYPVALSLRATPALCLGLLSAGWLAVRRRGGRAVERRALLPPLLGWAVVFVLAMSLAPKKMDRYVVAVVPALYLVATLGLLARARGARG